MNFHALKSGINKDAATQTFYEDNFQIELQQSQLFVCVSHIMDLFVCTTIIRICLLMDMNKCMQSRRSI